MRKKYPSDITRNQFEMIISILKGARKSTNPRKVDLYEVFCGLLYILKSGCQWRMLPSDFPNYNTVHYYFRIWSEQVNGNPSLLERCMKRLVAKHRTDEGREKNEFLHN